MLTFLVLRTYNIATLLRSLASASFTTLQVAVCHQRNQFTRKTAQKASTRPCLAGTQMIDRAWRSLKFEWLPAHINATQKKQDHTVLSPIVSELVFQWAWRQHQGPMSPNQFLKALQGLLKHWKNGMKQQYTNVQCKNSWETKVLASWKNDRNATAVCAACT